MSQEDKTVSIVILSYNNFKYLFDALSSVFEQNYENLQIVISNDGSADFDEDKLTEYVESNKSSNVKSVIVNNNERNIGTVKNFNKAIQLSDGDFVTFLAADDMLSAPDVISSFVKEFDKLGNDVQLIHSAVDLYDLDMKTSYSTLPTDYEKSIFLNKTPNQLYNELVLRGCYYPTTCCVRRELFDKIGFVDERVKYIEDWALYLSVYKNNISTSYLDKVTLNHRDGGICHGGDNYNENLNQRFADDELTIMENISSEPELLTPRNRKRFEKKYKELKYTYFLKFGDSRLTPEEARCYKRKIIPMMLLKGFNSLRHKVVAFFLKDYFSIPYIFTTILMYAIYRFSDFSALVGRSFNLFLTSSAGILCLCYIILFMLSLVIRFLYGFYITLKGYANKFISR